MEEKRLRAESENLGAETNLEATEACRDITDLMQWKRKMKGRK